MNLKKKLITEKHKKSASKIKSKINSEKFESKEVKVRFY